MSCIYDLRDLRRALVETGDELCEFLIQKRNLRKAVNLLESTEAVKGYTIEDVACSRKSRGSPKTLVRMSFCLKELPTQDDLVNVIRKEWPEYVPYGDSDHPFDETVGDNFDSYETAEERNQRWLEDLLETGYYSDDYDDYIWDYLW